MPSDSKSPRRGRGRLPLREAEVLASAVDAPFNQDATLTRPTTAAPSGHEAPEDRLGLIAGGRSRSTVPRDRVTVLARESIAAQGYVLYWMTAQRRLEHNFALQRACDWASALGAELVVFEPLRIDYRWASARHHAFIIDAMAEHLVTSRDRGWTYLPYVEPEKGHSKGLILALAAHSRLVVTDDTPGFFQRRMVQQVAPRLGRYVEAVDSNGIVPLRAYEKAFSAAAHLRRTLQKRVIAGLDAFPAERPLLHAAGGGDAPVSDALLQRLESSLKLVRLERGRRIEVIAALEVDTKVAGTERQGGASAARALLGDFVARGLPRYAEGRNHPDDPVASGLSPWLHMGHLSPHEVFTRVMQAEGWEPSRLCAPANGQREGFWGTSPAAEAFINQLVVWRELALNTAQYLPDHDHFETLPTWALTTLNAKAADPRPFPYSLPELDAAQTHDEVWNAAQRQLVAEGTMHNYLRMLWGKKILEWSPDPKTAFERALALNDRYALDGRDANSVAGVAWVFGRYDRPWAPVRPIFGAIRYMSSDNTRKKLHLREYLARWGPSVAAEGAQTALTLSPLTSKTGRSKARA